MASAFRNACLVLLIIISNTVSAQNFNFNFNTTGKRVCLAESEVDLVTPSVIIHLLDATSNSSNATDIYRRPLYDNGSAWVQVATAIPAGTATWTDVNVNAGEIWEYQLKRAGTWNYNSITYDATGYTIASLLKDNTDYRGQMILLVAQNIVDSLPAKYIRLKKELTGDGWLVNEIMVPAATGWDSGDTVVGIRAQVATIYNAAPPTDKPQLLFILGHVPMPRAGSTTVTAPDGHDQNKGARGCDGYYADVDGVYTDVATFNPGGLSTNLAINLPGDFKWDQDHFPSSLEMAFGRVDFKDLINTPLTEIELTEQYLDRLSNYKNVAAGFDMGNKSGFFFGYDNSNDGSYRSMPNISKAANVYQNPTNTTPPSWISTNGPFKVYMQNQAIPVVSDWDTYGMDATVFSSDQSYWGYNDVPQSGNFGIIRRLLGADTKCLVTLWTTSAVNTFHQACMGDALGLAIKQTIDYNDVNNNLERPQQAWDTPEWRNRTHLSYNGDPSIRLYQMQPASNLTIDSVNNGAILTWSASADTALVGYHIYKSTTEFGKYIRITTAPVTLLTYTDPTYTQNDWYMVRAVKTQESGCGKFLDPSQGIFIQGTFQVTVSVPEELLSKSVTLYPNPASSEINIVGNHLKEISITNVLGQTVLQQEASAGKTVVNISALKAGVYFVTVSDAKGARMTKRIVKE